MKIRHVGADLSYAVKGQTEERDEAKSLHFSQFF